MEEELVERFPPRIHGERISPQRHGGTEIQTTFLSSSSVSQCLCGEMPWSWVDRRCLAYSPNARRAFSPDTARTSAPSTSMSPGSAPASVCSPSQLQNTRRKYS